MDGLIKKSGRDMECRLRGTDRWNKETGRDGVWNEVGGKYEQYKTERREGGVQRRGLNMRELR